MRKNQGKLKLHRETVGELDFSAKAVAGGAYTVYSACYCTNGSFCCPNSNQSNCYTCYVCL